MGDEPGDRKFARFSADASKAPAFANAPVISDVTVVFETWGELDAERSNAILVEHALTGDSHAAGPSGPGHPTPGWWDALIGPGRALDTDRYFVVCPNVLGGCQGTTGPSSLDEAGVPTVHAFPPSRSGTKWPSRSR